MSTIATYSFLPWMRQGLAGQITALDNDTAVPGRASVEVKLRIAGDAAAGGALPGTDVARAVQIYGPGDVIGIDPRALVRTDPRDWITDTEPNYLTHVEFYDEDLPWRYTPAAPDGTGLRLRPWIALVVLEEDVEFDEVRAHAERPLPSIEVKDPAALPPAADLWAWAHVHVNTSLAVADELVQADSAQIAAKLAAAVASDRDIAYSRLVSPRRLKPHTRYHAFVVPTFETGRLAGLGLDPAGAPHATFSAWGDYSGKPAGATLPYYHRWYFRTGAAADFEYLVRLLQPRTMKPRVGVRDVDMRHPGSGIRGVTDPAFAGILKLGGALRVPDEALTAADLAERRKFDGWDRAPHATAPYPQDVQRDLAAFVNLPDDYALQTALDANDASTVATSGDPDPLITSPLYGRWHALTRRLLLDRDGNPVDPDDNWVHDLNLDPRHRVAAGFGTRVLQAGQERYMDAAWGQIGDVLEANRRIRLAQLAQLVGQGWWQRQLAAQVTTAPERVLRLTAPAHRHILVRDSALPSATIIGNSSAVAAPRATASQAANVRHRLALSAASTTLLSTPMRRITRPGARLARTLPFAGDITPASLLTRVDAGQVSAAPPVVTPPGLVTTDEVVDAIDVAPLPPWVPAPIARWLLDLLRRHRWMHWLVLALAIVLLVGGLLLVGVTGGTVAAVLGTVVIVVALVAAALWWALRRSEAQLDRADGLRPGALTVEAVDRLPDAPGFEITKPGTPATPAPTGATGDSPTAVRFKTALRDWARLHQASLTADATVAPVVVRYGTAGIAALAGGALAGLEPRITVPKRTLAGITLPGRIVADMVENFGEVMAYPRIDQPMYEPLRDLSDEYLLPNLNLIPPNTISLLETNQPFIEAYMVGVNHEMARELLWREYPTDQRGTPFRQFWDVSGARPEPGLDAEQAKESLLDIPELHRWPRRSHLGDHDHREKPGDKEQEVVLVIRGELLKKYPTAVIYAHRARWDSADGSPARNKERLLESLTAAQEGDPPTDLVKTPLYEARVHPDITFFGFDLTASAAKGESVDDPDDPGWFFCIKERPGEPRFGFDVEGETQPETVNDLAWSHVGVAEGAFVPAGALGAITLDPLDPDDPEKVPQRTDDDKAVLAPVSAARWAYLTYQSPVLVAVHAAEMLRPGET